MIRGRQPFLWLCAAIGAASCSGPDTGGTGPAGEDGGDVSASGGSAGKGGSTASGGSAGAGGSAAGGVSGGGNVSGSGGNAGASGGAGGSGGTPPDASIDGAAGSGGPPPDGGDAAGGAGAGGAPVDASTDVLDASAGSGGFSGAGGTSADAASEDGAPGCVIPGDTCHACLAAHCATEYCGCAADLACTSADSCSAGCGYAQSCEDGCVAGNLGSDVAYWPFSDCRKTHCISACGVPSPDGGSVGVGGASGAGGAAMDAGTDASAGAGGASGSGGAGGLGGSAGTAGAGGSGGGIMTCAPTSSLSLGTATASDAPGLAANVFSSTLGVVWTRSGTRTEAWGSLRTATGGYVPPVNADQRLGPQDADPASSALEAVTVLPRSTGGYWAPFHDTTGTADRIMVANLAANAVTTFVDPSSVGTLPTHPWAAAKSSSQFGMVYEAGSPPDIRFSRWNNLSYIAGTLVSSTPGASTSARVAWNGTGWTAIWHESTGEWRSAIIPDTGFSAADQGDAGFAGTDAALEWNGTGPIAAVANGSAIALYDGTLVDGGTSWLALGSGITASGAVAGTPALRWNGSVYAVAYAEGNPGDIRFAILSAAGALLGEGAVASGTSDAHAPALAWDGASWQVVWSDDRGSGRTLYLAKVGCQ